MKKVRGLGKSIVVGEVAYSAGLARSRCMPGRCPWGQALPVMIDVEEG